MRRPLLPFAGVLAIAAASSSAAAAPRALGLNAHQSVDVGLDATRDAGLGYVRIDLNWLNAEPSQGAYDFALFDAITQAASTRGLKVLAVLGYTPMWASSGDTKADGALNDVPLDGTYAAFVTATVQHFQGKIDHYELWNEPNLSQFFEGTPQDYVQRVLVPGATAVHAACPTCKVLAPGVATVGGEYAVWLDATLAAAKDKIDIVSGHVYAGFPVDSPGVGMTSDSFFNKLDQHRILKIGDQVIYEGPLSFREVMDKHAVTAPFWLTETGKEAPIGDAAALAAQTLYYRRVLESMLGRPWWEATIFYESFDEPNTGYTWGVVLHDPAAPGGYQAKPVMSLLKQVTSTQPVFGGKGGDCGDGLDNEGDGFVDYPADPDCTSILAKSEGLPPPDGGVAGGGGGGAGGGASSSGAGGAGGGAKGGCGCEMDEGGAGGGAAIATFLLGALGVRRRRRGQG